MANDGTDPLADMQNAIGFQGLVGPNPYLQYQGKIPMAGFSTAAGPPTDAMGNPIQSYVDANNAAQSQYQQQLAAFNAQQQQQTAPGTTLNSMPQHGAGALQPGQWDAPGTGLATGTPTAPVRLASTSSGTPQGFGFAALSGPSPGGPSTQAQYAYNQGLGGIGPSGSYNPASAVGQAWTAQQQQAQPQAQGATPPSPPDMRQAYLSALANPGKVNTPGAQAIPGTTPTGPYGYNIHPGVTNAFLQAHPTGGQATGPGVQNQGFFNTLNKLQQGGPTLSAMTGGGGL